MVYCVVLCCVVLIQRGVAVVSKSNHMNRIAENAYLSDFVLTSVEVSKLCASVNACYC